MVLSCNGIKKSFGTDEIMKHVSFHLEANEKTAIVGINGTGKTTLLKIIMQEIMPDSGEVTIAKGKTIGYLAQNQQIVGNNTIYEEVLLAKKYVISLEQKIRTMEQKMKDCKKEDLPKFMEVYHQMSHEFEQLGGYAYQSEITGVLKGLGFLEEDFTKEVSKLSGGQKTRVSLSKLLVTKPDIILLDEPTNHLDISAISWLETFLLNYKGTVLIVSHDRYFLDKIVTKVIELDQGNSMTFLGNYSDYAVKKQQVRDALLKQYYNQQREIKHQEEVITKLKSFNREKSIKRAESREKLLNKVERLEKPREEKSDMNLSLNPKVLSGKDVLSVKELSKSYEPTVLFENISFEIKRGERIALIGDNGTGKTTILKIINQLVEADKGEILLGTNVNIGYYDQEHQVLSKDKNLLEEISDTYETLTHTEIRNVLAAFLFTGDDVKKRIKDLSGGECGRVSLAKLMLSNANFLILDEPTNHLDIISKEILEHALTNYTGTVLFVSHDRYFINKTATRILDLSNCNITNYIGNYDYYIEKRAALVQKTSDGMINSCENDMQEESDAKLSWKQQKEEQAKQRKIESDRKKIEEKIGLLEQDIEKMEEKFLDQSITTNVEELVKLQDEYDKKKLDLESCYELWEASFES